MLCVFLVFVVASCPILWFDTDSLQIPIVWVLSLPLSLLVALFFLAPARLPDQLLGATLVLIVGMLLFFLLPDKLGEADIIYAASLALCSTFYPFLAALGLACLGAFGLFTWIALTKKNWNDLPVAFTPLIFWGAVSQFLFQVQRGQT